MWFTLLNILRNRHSSRWFVVSPVKRVEAGEVTELQVGWLAWVGFVAVIWVISCV